MEQSELLQETWFDEERAIPAVLGSRAGWVAGSLAGVDGGTRTPPPVTRVGLAEGRKVGCSVDSMPAPEDGAAVTAVGWLGAGGGRNLGDGGVNWRGG